MDRYTDSWMDVWMGRWLGGWMEYQTDRLINRYRLLQHPELESIQDVPGVLGVVLRRSFSLRVGVHAPRISFMM